MTALILLSDWQKSQIEFWRKIEGFAGYDVSSFGRVRSWWQRGGWRYGYVLRRDRSPIILNCSGHKQGYVTTTLAANGKRKTFMVHRLVASAFQVNFQELPEVNHLTGLKHDNRNGNLEWSSRLANQRHAWNVGLITSTRVRAGQGWLSKVFTEQDILDMRARRANGESCESLRKEYGVSNGCISEIVTGVTFQEVGGARTLRHQYNLLSEDNVREIRQMAAAKVMTQSEIAKRFNIHQGDVSSIAARKRYKYVSG